MSLQSEADFAIRHAREKGTTPEAVLAEVADAASAMVNAFGGQAAHRAKREAKRDPTNLFRLLVQREVERLVAREHIHKADG